MGAFCVKVVLVLAFIFKLWVGLVFCASLNHTLSLLSYAICLLEPFEPFMCFIRSDLGAPGLATRSKKLLGAKGIATRSKDMQGRY